MQSILESESDGINIMSGQRGKGEARDSHILKMYGGGAEIFSGNEISIL